MKRLSRFIVLTAAFVAGIASRAWAVWPTSVSFVHQKSGMPGDVFDVLTRAVTGLALLYVNLLLVAVIVRMALKLRSASGPHLDAAAKEMSAKGTTK